MEQRLLSHNELSTKGYTIRYRPWTIVLTEEFKTKGEARDREKQLKGGQGRAFVWNEIERLGLISTR